MSQAQAHGRMFVSTLGIALAEAAAGRRGAARSVAYTYAHTVHPITGDRENVQGMARYAARHGTVG